MTRIENVHFGIGHVPAVCLGLFDLERRVEATPQDQGCGSSRGRLMCRAGQRAIGCSNRCGTPPTVRRGTSRRRSSVQRSGSYADTFGLVPTCRWRVASKDKKFTRRAASLLPRSAQKVPTGLPEWAQSVLVSDGVLDHQGSHSIGTCCRQAEPYGASVVLHEEVVAVDTKEVGEAFDDASNVVEGVVEPCRVRRFAVAKSWIVGSDQMEGVGQRA